MRQELWAETTLDFILEIAVPPLSLTPRSSRQSVLIKGSLSSTYPHQILPQNVRVCVRVLVSNYMWQGEQVISYFRWLLVLCLIEQRGGSCWRSMELKEAERLAYLLLFVHLESKLWLPWRQTTAQGLFYPSLGAVPGWTAELCRAVAAVGNISEASLFPWSSASPHLRKSAFPSWMVTAQAGLEQLYETWSVGCWDLRWADKVIIKCSIWAQFRKLWGFVFISWLNGN